MRLHSGCTGNRVPGSACPNRVWARALELCFGHFQSPQEALRLVERFLTLHFWNAVGDNAGACLEIDGLALEDQSAQPNARVHVAAEVDVTDGPSVRTSPRRLQLIDNLHGPHL